MNTYVELIVNKVRREAMVWLKAGRPLPFGVDMKEHAQRVEEYFIEIAEELSLQGRVDGLGECPGLSVSLSRRGEDWFILVNSAVGEAPRAASEKPDPFLVRDTACLTREEATLIARVAKVDELKGESMSDYTLIDLIVASFEAGHAELRLDESAVAIQVSLIRRMVRNNTILQLNGLDEGMTW